MCLFWRMVDLQITSVCDLAQHNKAAAPRIRCKLFELAPSLTCDANTKTETVCLPFEIIHGRHPIKIMSLTCLVSRSSYAI